MGFLADIKMGNTITKLTNLFEEMRGSHNYHFIGGGGGIDSLPEPRRNYYEKNLEKWLNILKKHPRHKITQTVIQNIKMSQSSNRVERIEAQTELLDFLVDEGLALNLEDFEKSYL